MKKSGMIPTKRLPKTRASIVKAQTCGHEKFDTCRGIDNLVSLNWKGDELIRCKNCNKHGVLKNGVATW